MGSPCEGSKQCKRVQASAAVCGEIRGGRVAAHGPLVHVAGCRPGRTSQSSRSLTKKGQPARGPSDAPRPELFTPAAQSARATGSFLPFSAGAKGCPAAAFALHEMRVLVVMTLQRYTLRFDGGVCIDTRQGAPVWQGAA